jgi:lantibiotic modifying enzyme
LEEVAMTEYGARGLSRRELVKGALGAASVLVLPGSARAQLERSTRHSNDPHVHNARADWLDTAVRAERWLRSVRIAAPNGVVWPADPTDVKTVQTNLYTGTPGVVLFLLELYRATGTRAYLDEARAGADALIARLPADNAEANCGLYTGLAGTGFVLTETWRATDDARYRAAAQRIVDALHARAKTVGRGVEWNESTDIISGTAGIALYLLYAHEALGSASAVELAARGGRRLIELGRPEKGGLKWAISPTVPNLYPNFSHGAAGVGYTLARLNQSTRDKAFLDAALSAAAYLDAVADRTRGCKVFHHEPGGEDLFYLSWCHGGAGTARLWYILGQMTGDAAWTERIHCYATGITEMGAPQARSPGYWNNISQCCGNCGVGEFFLSAHRLFPERGYLTVAQRAATDTAGRATAAGDGVKWIQAEHRVRPELLVAQTGFMQGAAGVGTLFVHLHEFDRGAKLAIRWPDSPFV